LIGFKNKFGFLKEGSYINDMEKLVKIKAMKIALITVIVIVFVVTLLPMFSPIMNVIRTIVGCFMIGWWTGKGIIKIWDK
jgi:hypothetical protein